MSCGEEERMNRTLTKESFSSELKNAHELFSGEELYKVLYEMRNSLDDPDIISADNIFCMLNSFRDIQDYDGMITLVDELNANAALKFVCTPHIIYLHAFALNRRNEKTDREKAENLIKKALEDETNQNPNFYCLYGRIWKDKFVESDYTDKESLDNAIYWYRKSYEMEPNEYAGINLATLLVARGNDFFTCPEVHEIILAVNSKLSEKGNLDSIKNYWDVATVFEICVLSKDYAKANLAADCMAKLKPALWCLKSTVGNIKIIIHSKPVPEEVEIPEIAIFNFWMDFFVKATEKVEETGTRFPVLVLSPTNACVPSYIALDVETKSCTLSNLCVDKSKGKCTNCHEHFYNADCIKRVSVNEHNKSLLHLCLHDNSQKMVVFPSTHDCKAFHLRLQELFPNVIPIRNTQD